MPQSEPLFSSESGEQAARDRLDDFGKLLQIHAEKNARQRGAALVDDADVTSAYREIMTIHKLGFSGLVVRVVGGALVLGGGTFGAYAINIWKDDKTSWMMLVAGGLAAIVGFILQYIKPERK